MAPTKICSANQVRCAINNSNLKNKGAWETYKIPMHIKKPYPTLGKQITFGQVNKSIRRMPWH